jgi:hypothetical protein
MNIILASLITLPELVDGKVCVVDSSTATYTLHKPCMHCTISDNFNPLDYAIAEKYNNGIVYSNRKERETYLVNKQIAEMHKPKALKLFGKGDKIHLHSRNGIYEVVSYNDHTIIVTCKKWQNEPNRCDHTRTVPSCDFKCVAGGRHNSAY